MRPVCSRLVGTRRGLHSRTDPLNCFISQPPCPSDDARSAHPPFTLAVKDNIATADLPTTCASRMLSSHRSPMEATVVRQLRERGARVVGKTNMDEFGMGSHSTNSAFGPVRGSLDPAASAGGSSGGSAVAVATGAADVALGTDTGGSVRVPAAYAGVVGYKPSYGMLSRWGVVPYANSLDTVGLLARDAPTLERLVFGTGLDHEHDPRDPTSLSARARERCRRAHDEDDAARRRLALFRGGRVTVGLPLEYNVEELDPAMRRTWVRVAAVLGDRGGARVVPVSLPTTRRALPAYYVLAPAEASSNLAKYDSVRYGTRTESAPDGLLYAGTRGAGFGPEVKRRILLGTYSLSSAAMDNHFLQAQRVRRLVQRDFDRIFARRNPLYDAEDQQFDLEAFGDGVAMEDKLGPAQVDFLLCPTLPGFAPGLDDVAQMSPVDAYMNDVFTVPASLAGLPAVSVPVAVEGESVGAERGTRSVAGMQLIGQYWDDARMLRFAGMLRDLLS